MKAENREKLLQAFDEAAKQLGDGRWSLDEISAGAFKIVPIVKFFISAIENAQSRDHLAAFFDISEDPDPEELELAISLAKLVPAIMKDQLPKLNATANEILPSAPQGRPKASSAFRREVCDYVLQLFGKGVRMEICKKRAAAHFCIGLRSVERYMGARGKTDLDLDTAKTIAANLFARKFKELGEPQGAGKGPAAQSGSSLIASESR